MYIKYCLNGSFRIVRAWFSQITDFDGEHSTFQRHDCGVSEVGSITTRHGGSLIASSFDRSGPSALLLKYSKKSSLDGSAMAGGNRWSTAYASMVADEIMIRRSGRFFMILAVISAI